MRLARLTNVVGMGLNNTKPTLFSQATQGMARLLELLALDDSLENLWMQTNVVDQFLV